VEGYFPDVISPIENFFMKNIPNWRKTSALSILIVSFVAFACKDDEQTPAAEVVAISPVAGPKGTALTIAGDNFGTAMSDVEVTINDKPAEIASVANNKIVVIIPDKAGSGKVSTKIRGVALPSQPVFTYQLYVSTLAGNGAAGFANGTGESAKFYGPSGLGLDADENLIVTDNSNNIVRKVSKTGVVTTVAGSLTSGYVDGPADIAQFAGPNGAVVDKSGNIFLADEDSNTIRKITPDGTVSTFAGFDFGFADGTGGAARFGSPSGIAIDKDDNLYVADQINHRIRKITPTAIVTTLAGSGTPGWLDGTGVAAKFFRPVGVAVDQAGNVFVGDLFNHRIRKISPAGVVTTVAGTGVPGFADGDRTVARFQYPAGLAVDADGVLYVADTENNSIRKVDPNGNVSTLTGRNDGHLDGTLENALFKSPREIEIASDGTIYIVDNGSNRIRKID
jgi:sugar lactone lactonase YvrE